jgi:small subunit ribosomal protein S7
MAEKEQTQQLEESPVEEAQEEVIDQMAEIEPKEGLKIFDLYDTQSVLVEDQGLKRVISLVPKTVLKSKGRIRGKFAQTKVNIVERLIRILSTPGHRGKKHKVMTRTTGKFNQNTKVVLKAFKIIEDKTKQNPVQVLVKAIENGSPREEITTIEYGGAKYPQAVDTSPIRRVNLTLRLMVHGAYDKSFNKKTKIPQALAAEIMAAADGSQDSFAVTKKNEAEKQANSAR